jgi:subtilisin family serine protease
MDRQDIEAMFYGRPDQQRRFTQDFPVLPDVWIAYGTKPGERQELLLTPHSRSDSGTAAAALRERLKAELSVKGGGKSYWAKEHAAGERPRILFNESVVLAHFSFWELMRVAMPLTDWWRRAVAPLGGNWSRENILAFVKETEKHKPGSRKMKHADPRLLKKLIAVAGAIECARKGRGSSPAGDGDDAKIPAEQVQAFVALFQGLTNPSEDRGLIWGVSLNRRATTSIWRSRNAVKADAAARLFNVDTSGIRWAVLDTGIDAKHDAFLRRGANNKIDPKARRKDASGQFESRVVATYDFLRIKDLLDPDPDRKTQAKIDQWAKATLHGQELQTLKSDLRHSLQSGRAIDWRLLEPFLRIPHDKSYVPPSLSHGTHVAGILAADWPEARKTSLEQKLQGMCPELEVYDLRVLGTDSDEFTVIAALQFVRYLNAHKDLMTIHGVNLSMSVPHDVANYACGRTPVCEECERVVSSGVVVVTAAGNRGFNKLASPSDGATGDYRFISITDPGNADSVITVGSTHRFMPHSYGVSYFSSRGPTGDGRTKPDLVAPGERIDSTSPRNDFETMDGTSMAAPHVSGAAALLIGRHRELVGQPKRVKEILIKSATDLGREPRFQGGGMLDVLRALQSV